jgi:UDP-GlcNAc3NAcA epimerase
MAHADMRKIVSIVGARPQFIKAAVVSRALTLANVNDVLLHTGQHYDFEMSEVFFNELGLPAPQYSLGIGSGPHGRQTGRMLEAIEKALVDEGPEMVVTYGDTNSTLAGALAAAKLHIPVAHVEAGLRSFNRLMPEELNRVLTDHMADLLFAPTSTAVRNLKNEGICPERIIRTGDVMYDAAMKFAEDGEMVSGVLQRLNLQSGAYILATLHRSENTGNPERLRAILEGLAQITQEFPVVLPLHPRTRNELEHVRVAPEALQRLTLMEPVGYLDMAMLEKHARLIATDSGGVQKEAYFHGVTCVTLRGETEWIESMRRGCNTLAFPASAAAVAASVRKALARKPLFQSGIYGDGHSAEHIAKTIACWRPNKKVEKQEEREHSFAGDQ